MVFEYVPPAEAYDVERTHKLQVPLGIMVVPIGFKFRVPDESGYRQVSVYQSTGTEKVRFELRASREQVDGAPDAKPPNETGFHIIFNLRGAVVRQFFLAAQLVQNVSAVKEEETETPELYTFDLEQLKQFDKETVQAQQRVAVALQQVLK